MTLEHLERVHVGLPVFDKSIVVCGHHPVIIVAPFHGADSGIVGLLRDVNNLQC